MNILTIIKKLKEKHMIPDTEEGIALFSDCFNKFGISLLLLKEEDKFSRILDILETNDITLQKANGMYALRIFAVSYNELENIVNEYFAINEVGFLRQYPEIIAEAKTVHAIAENMKKFQSKNISYKDGEMYDINKLLSGEDIEDTIDTENVNLYLKKHLKNPELLDRLENNEANNDEEDFNVALELQKVENKICEEYLLPVDDGWKIVINDKEVNSFQEVKNTISTIIKLNLSLTFDDALLIVLFYKTSLTVSEVDEIIHNHLYKGGEGQ